MEPCCMVPQHSVTISIRKSQAGVRNPEQTLLIMQPRVQELRGIPSSCVVVGVEGSLP